MALSGILYFLARRSPEGVERVFAPISRLISGVLGKVFSFAPFSIVEFLFYALLLAVPVSIIFLIVRLLTGGGLRALAGFFSWWALTASSLLAIFLLFWGLNYYAPPFTEKLGYETREYSVQELYDAAEYYAEKMNSYAVQVPRDESGVAQLGNFSDLADISVDAMEALGRRYPDLQGILSKPKAITWTEMMNRTSISGIYSPFTGECNVNGDVASLTLPFTMCHELSHRLGVTMENEANFVGFLACENADDAGARYSAYYYAFVYCYNAVAEIDPELQAELFYLICDETRADIADIRARNEKYESKLEDVTEKINDTYLKAMDQEDGVQSYGKVVDLLIAHYLDIGA